MRWHILSSQISSVTNHAEIIHNLLEERKLGDSRTFLHPPDPLTMTPSSVGIDEMVFNLTLKRIRQAITSGQPIIIFGDYDADGVTATAVLWETLNLLGAKVYPFLPSRERHGYGLSVTGIQDALLLLKSKDQSLKPLFITVDNGIVAHEAATYLKKQGIDLIITDHHLPGDSLPACYALVHTEKLAGVGVAWMLAKALNPSLAPGLLDLVAIGTVADMLPLVGPNRSLVKSGLETLKTTKRPGLLALYNEAGIDAQNGLSTYHVNYVIAPRLNAMGRLEHALDSLRLLLTTNLKKAQNLAQLLSDTNKSRQDLTKVFIDKAEAMVGKTSEHLIVVADAAFHEGVIGLVAGKLVEKYYRPSIVISRGETISKASVRSVAGVNIIEYLRLFSRYYINCGGHPLAAGFTIESGKIDGFKQAIQTHALKAINQADLIPQFDIDCEISLDAISMALYQDLQPLKPFGMGNREPVFCVHDIRIGNARTVGKTGDHLKLTLQAPSGTLYQAIGFGLGHFLPKLGDHCSVAFTLEENVWQGQHSLQLHLKDIQL